MTTLPTRSTLPAPLFSFRTRFRVFCVGPGHPQRVEAGAGMLKQPDIPALRRSDVISMGKLSGSARAASGDGMVQLGDSLGERFWSYAAGKVAVVAGSF